MGEARLPQPVRPILGMLARRPESFEAALRHVAARWGGPDMASEPLDFTFTDYYEPEMGAPLKRRFFSWPAPMDPGDLAEVKLWTNEIEEQVAKEGVDDTRRPVNLDPGYVDDCRLVLATTKDHAHRIYLGRGIYAEVTLSWRQGAWQAMPWTYPDYRTTAYALFFQEARARYLRARRP
jgi:hypothetical protein